MAEEVHAWVRWRQGKLDLNEEPNKWHTQAWAGVGLQLQMEGVAEELESTVVIH